MQWDASPAAGFTTGTPYLGIDDGYATHSVAAASADSGSILGHFRKMIAIRRGTPALLGGKLTVPAVSDPACCYAFVRSDAASRRDVAVVLNLTGRQRTVSLDFTPTPLAIRSGTAVAGPDLLDGMASFGDLTPASSRSYRVTVPARGARILPFTR
jgi:glycosidase